MFWIWNIEQKIFVHWTIVWNRQDWCWKIECRWFNVRWAVEKIYTWKCDSDVAFYFVSTVRPFTFFFEIKCWLATILIHHQKYCQKKTNSNFETVWNITMNEANMTIVNELFLNKNIIAVIETMKQKWT